ncbi:MAG TPA: glycosyltransferase family 39 protein [Bryobacteraceae bacterium]|nr:glycosyltransferase family 39 protein [Bryobacteraceae bacterium]
MLFFSGYALILLTLIPVLSLWLDEVLQLIGVRDMGLQQLLEYAPVNLGGVPFGYVVAFSAVKLFGYSIYSARLPSAVFSLLASAGVLFLARQIGLRRPLLAPILFVCFPLQLRYAVEARPYSLALCLTTWGTISLLRLLDRPSLKRAIPYFLCTLLGIYTQPFTLFVPCAHLVWLLANSRDRQYRQCWIWAASSVLIAGLSFLPWYLYASPKWRDAIGPDEYQVPLKALLLVSKELIGSGHVSTAIAGGLACLGRATLPRRERLLWSLYIVMPIGLALLADAAFGYFLAIRQMIFVLIPLALMAALGVEHIWRKSPRTTALLTAGFLLLLVGGNISFFQRPREDWKAASDAIASELHSGNCVIFAPLDSLKLYRFFRPELVAGQCPTRGALPGPVLVAVAPYELEDSFDVIRKRLEPTRRVSRQLEFNGPKIIFFEETPMASRGPSR